MNDSLKIVRDSLDYGFNVYYVLVAKQPELDMGKDEFVYKLYTDASFQKSVCISLTIT